MSGPFPRQAGGGSELCRRCESALTELVDGTLSSAEDAALRAHAAQCESCRPLLAAAQDGKAWLRLLHDSPPPVPEALLGKVLAQTSAHPVRGMAEPHPMHGVPASIGTALAPVWAASGSRQNRWLMTSAMAFFSIAATLSVAGVHTSDLHPQAVQAAASRQFFDVKKQVVSFYDNLALVRELQSTIDGLHQNSNSGKGNSWLGPGRSFTLRSLPKLSLLAGTTQADERKTL